MKLVGAAVVGCVALALLLYFQLHWFAVHTGTVNESSPYYGAFSGWVSDLGELAIIGGLLGAYRKVNCHEPRCWRIGHHTTADGFKLCKTHIAKPKSELNLHDIHPSHR